VCRLPFVESANRGRHPAVLADRHGFTFAPRFPVASDVSYGFNEGIPSKADINEMMLSVEERLRELATDHVAAIAAFLRHRRYPLPEAELDDLIEETLVATWRRLEDCPEGAERAWMIGIARNVLRNAKRSARRRTSLNESIDDPGPSPSAEAWVLASQAVRDAMAALSDGDRDVLMLHHWDGLTTREIAVACDIGEKAAGSRLQRAQSRLRQALEIGPRRKATSFGH